MPAITLTPTSTNPGATITVNGTGFVKLANVRLILGGSSYSTYAYKVKGNGTFTGSMQTSASASAGTQRIDAIYDGSPANILATANFTLVVYVPPPSADTTPPVISNVAYYNVTQTGATISWLLNEYASGQVEYGPTIPYSNLSTFQPCCTYNSHNQILSGLNAGTLYHFRVRSKDAAGNEAISADSTFTTVQVVSIAVPSAPLNLGIVPTSTLALAWSAPTSNGGSIVTSYKIYKDGVLLISTPNLNYVDVAVTNGVSYSYQVSAVNVAGEGPKSNIATAIPTASVTPPADLQAAINALPVGGSLNLAGGTYSGSFTIAKALTLMNGTINVPAGQNGLVISANDVTIAGTKVVGAQHAIQNGELGINVQGTLAVPLLRVSIRNCDVSNLGGMGIILNHVSNLTVSNNTVYDIGYTGIMIESGLTGTVSSNIIRRVGYTPGMTLPGGDNAYGIAITYVENPRSADITVNANTVEDVPRWHGLDTHAGQRITFSNNIVRRSSRALFVTAGDSEFDPPRDIIISGNQFLSPAPVTFNLVPLTLVVVGNVQISGNRFEGWAGQSPTVLQPYYDYPVNGITSTGIVVGPTANVIVP